MSAPRFTLALYVQNAELHLARALRSVLHDPSATVELLAIDAGSRDDSLPQLREWAEKDARVRVVALGPCAQAEAFNVGISLAKGRSLGLMDARDWLDEGAWTALASQPEADLIVAGSRDCTRTSLVRSRRRAWGLWFSVELLRRTGARVGAQRVDDDLLLMLDALSSAETIACVPQVLHHRGAPSHRVVAPPLVEVVDERLINVERLVREGALSAALGEGLEVATLMRGLPAEALLDRAPALRRLVASAVRQKES